MLPTKARSHSLANLESSASGEEYCGDCGAVVTELSLTADYSFEASAYANSNHIRHDTLGVAGDTPGARRLQKRRNQDMLRQAHEQIEALCQRLHQSGLTQRAQRIFTDAIIKLVAQPDRGKALFGKHTKGRVAAVVYVAAVESGQSVALASVAEAMQLDVFSVGSAAKEVIGLLGMHLQLADPLLWVERAIDRLLAYGTLQGQQGSDYEDVLECIAGTEQAARDMPRLLLGYLASASSERAGFKRIAGQTVDFCRFGDRHMGMNPASVTGTAVALALEHLLLRSGCTRSTQLKRCQRRVVVRLVALATNAGWNTLMKHVGDMQKSLVRAAQTVPWLRDTRVTQDSSIAHLGDILFCCEQARACLFTTQDETDDARRGSPPVAVGGVPALALDHIAGDAPAYARVQTRRAKRQKMLESQDPSDEARAIRRLCELGVDAGALLSLPMHTLVDVGAATARKHTLDQDKTMRARLDSTTIGADDMDEAELEAYIVPDGGRGRSLG
ncbi:hypothetical protein GGI07_004928 [Coemansia sp. Benny D115]|nr:hypothetical protein GGI07_004928 [Coemansia sp. Benny D115]